MKKIMIIDPEFNFLQDYLDELPSKFDSVGKVIQSNRNIIREDKVQDVRLVIKSYRRIYLINRIRYTYLYPSKAQRAFDYAKVLLEKGFHTPRPIAYIEIIKNGLINQSYFISEYTDFQPLNTIFTLTLPHQMELLKEVARFTYRLHQNNIYHIDYSVGNILFKQINGRYEFSLIDNNRIKFSTISFEKGIGNLKRLGLPVEHLTWIGKEYARLWNVDEIISMERLFHYKRNQLERNRVKKSMKNLLASFKSLSW